MAARSTTAIEGDVYSVLIGLRDLMREHIGRGDKVTIYGIGSFAVNVSSEGAESEDKFYPTMLKGAKVAYRQDAEMKEFTKNVKFEK